MALRQLTRAGVLAALLAALGAAAQPAEAPAARVFARVGEVLITQQEYESAVAQAARSKFYHGKPPEGEMAALQREVAQKMVDQVLLAGEAQRRKVRPDADAVRKAIEGYEARYARSERWKAERDQVLPAIRAKLEIDSLVDQLAKEVKAVPAPDEQQLQRYWSDNQDKFTSPEQVRVSIILLKVDPSSPPAKWEGAKEEGAAIVKRLKDGADWKELVHLHSGDGSAERGGELGYLHRGMLPDAAQEAVDKLQPGQFTDAVVLLEGVAILRLEERLAPKLNPLSAVRERARDLFMRDAGDKAWDALLAQLRQKTPVQLDDSVFLPLPVAASPAEAATQR